MFCEKCGTELEDGAKFCKNCGSPVGGPEPDSCGCGCSCGCQAGGSCLRRNSIFVIAVALVLCAVFVAGIFIVGTDESEP